ncbi:MAG: type IV pilus twitching motility protein PilT [bacterium]
MDIKTLLFKMVELKSSDIHLAAGCPPLYRIDGRLVSIGMRTLSESDTKEMAYSMLNEFAQSKFNSGARELDFSFGIEKIGRVRANVHYQRGSVSVALRMIPIEIPKIHTLGLPSAVKNFSDYHQGLILVTGATGSGKSTTLASLIDMINSKYSQHIITVEDPIEFLHRNKKSLITQREVGMDTESFPNALRSILRQDPDTVLIGEMRDLETIQAALTIAETGHLTFATLHTNSSVETITRIIDAFPPGQQNQVSTQLSFVLQAVLCQQLLPKVNGGRILATEVMIANSAIKNLVREGKPHQIQNIIQSNQAETGMQTMNQSLVSLYTQGLITKNDAIQRSIDIQNFKKLIQEVETGL